MLTGHPPFPEGTLPQRLMMHQTRPASVFDDRPDVPDALVDICSRMMDKSPDDRFQNCGEVRDALAAWLRGDPGTNRTQYRLGTWRQSIQASNWGGCVADAKAG